MFRELLLFCGLFMIVLSYPTGPPISFCNLIGTDVPIHNVTSQPISTLPYKFTASSNEYHSGSTIDVTISGDTFIGFMVQGRDSNTHEWIGQFQSSNDVQLIPDCGAISHSDPKEKTEITLTWKAPTNSEGEIYFIGILMKDFKTFWSNVISKV